MSEKQSEQLQAAQKAWDDLWHVLTNAAFLVAYEQRKIGEDDRP